MEELKLPVAVVFLDVDGVIAVSSNVRSTGALLHASAPPALQLKRVFDEIRAMIVLKEHPGCNCPVAVVLSTSWRENERSRKALLEVLSQIDSEVPVIGDTPQLVSQARSAEILAWVARDARVRRKHGAPALLYVAVDDLDLRPLEFFVHTDVEVGLDASHANAMIHCIREQVNDSAASETLALCKDAGLERGELPWRVILDLLVGCLENIGCYMFIGDAAAYAHSSLGNFVPVNREIEVLDVLVWLTTFEEGRTWDERILSALPSSAVTVLENGPLDTSFLHAAEHLLLGFGVKISPSDVRSSKAEVCGTPTSDFSMCVRVINAGPSPGVQIPRPGRRAAGLKWETLRIRPHEHIVTDLFGVRGVCVARLAATVDMLIRFDREQDTISVLEDVIAKVQLDRGELCSYPH